MGRPLLTFNITKKFQGFTLECEAAFDSGITAIFGPSGSGKTTLLKILSRITEPTSGRATTIGRVSSLLEVGTGFHPELTGDRRFHRWIISRALHERRIEG